jgi:hypothetical protein
MTVVMLSADQRYRLLLILQQNGVMQRLADLARVPKIEGAREYFSRFILRILSDAWHNDGLRDAAFELQSTNPALSRAARALRSARQALAYLDKGEREALWWPISEVESGIDLFFEFVLGGFEPTRPQAHRRGRRSGTVKNRAFQIFVRGLFFAAETADGRYTLEKNIGRGTVSQAIEILTPYLPDGFVPKNLPFSTLQRIKSTLPKRRNGGYRTRTKN